VNEDVSDHLTGERLQVSWSRRLSIEGLAKFGFGEGLGVPTSYPGDLLQKPVIGDLHCGTQFRADRVHRCVAVRDHSKLRLKRPQVRTKK